MKYYRLSLLLLTCLLASQPALAAPHPGYYAQYQQELTTLARLESQLAPYLPLQAALEGEQSHLATIENDLAPYAIPELLTGRDLATANPALTNSFNAQRTRDGLEAMNVFSETAMRLVGDLYQPYTEEVNQAERALAQARASGDATQTAAAQTRLETARAALAAMDGERIALHGLVGGLTALLGGADPVSGLVGGASGKLATLEMEKLIAARPELANHPVVRDALLALSATAAGSITGGSTGGYVGSQGDRFNRQLHWSEYGKLKSACGKSASTVECRTLQRMQGSTSRMLSDVTLPEDNVVANYDAQGKIVSYTLTDKTTQQPWLIMEPLEFAVYRDYGHLARSDYRQSSQGELDQASYLLYAVNGNLSRAGEHLYQAWTDEQTLRDAAISTLAGGLAGRLAGMAKGATQSVNYATEAELEALRRIAGNPAGAGLAARQADHILALQQQKRFDELADLFDKQQRTQTVRIGDTSYVAKVENQRAGTTRYADTSAMSEAQLQNEVMRYGQQLAGGKPLELKAAGVWAARLDDGTIINVRSVSSSENSRWTVDVRGGQVSDVTNLRKIGLKFK